MVCVRSLRTSTSRRACWTGSNGTCLLARMRKLTSTPHGKPPIRTADHPIPEAHPLTMSSAIRLHRRADALDSMRCVHLSCSARNFSGIKEAVVDGVEAQFVVKADDEDDSFRVIAGDEQCLPARHTARPRESEQRGDVIARHAGWMRPGNCMCLQALTIFASGSCRCHGSWIVAAPVPISAKLPSHHIIELLLMTVFPASSLAGRAWVGA